MTDKVNLTPQQLKAGRDAFREWEEQFCHYGEQEYGPGEHAVEMLVSEIIKRAFEADSATPRDASGK